MNFLFKGEIIDYSHLKTNKKTILFLHGWGGNKNSFIQTINLLKKNYSILTLTMPTISPTITSWTLLDYANLILNLTQLLNIKNLIIICHSFGFRVACLLNKKINIEKIIVTAGAGPKKHSIIKKINLNNNKILLKQKRFNYLYNKIISNDYKVLTSINKKTFNNIVKINTINLCNFCCPMLLFWGKNDTDTKIWIAKHINKINNSKLIVTKSNHFAYLNYSALFNNAVLDFLK